MPSKSLPSESFPSESLPSESLPSESLPLEPLPSESLPLEPLPSESLPLEPLSSESLTSGSLPSEPLSSQSLAPIPSALPAHPPQQIAKRIRHLFWGTLRLGVSGGLVFAGVAYLLQQQQTLTSHKGFINGSISTVKAPLTGELQLAALQAGDQVSADQVMGTVENPRNPQLELQRQAMETRVQQAKTQLTTLRQKQEMRRARLDEIRQTQTVKKEVVFQYDSQRIEQIQSDIRRDQQAIATDLREYERLAKLADAGAIPQREADQAQDRHQQSKLALENTQQRLKQAQAEQIAAQRGIQLQSGGETEESELRVQALETEISDLQLEEVDLQSQILQAQQEQEHLLKQLSLQKKASVKSPVSGIVWATEHKAGVSPVNVNEPLLQVLDCNRTWVESFVSERELSQIKVGTPVTVRWLGQRDQTAQGLVRSVRAGVGRLAIGEGVAVPPPEQSRREVGVQIDWVNPVQDLPSVELDSVGHNSVKLDDVSTPQTMAEQAVPSPPPISAAQFCGVGQSVEVTFERQSSEQPAVVFWQNPWQWISQQNWSRFSLKPSAPDAQAQITP